MRWSMGEREGGREEKEREVRRYEQVAVVVPSHEPPQDEPSVAHAVWPVRGAWPAATALHVPLEHSSH
jgi:hypothetical protein